MEDSRAKLPIKTEGRDIAEKAVYLENRAELAFDALDRRKEQIKTRLKEQLPEIAPEFNELFEVRLHSDRWYNILEDYCERISIMSESASAEAKRGKSRYAADWIAGEKALVRTNK